MAGQLTIDTLKASSGVLATQNGMTGIAKAWANFSATGGTITINNSFNVSSITYVSTGIFTVNFTTAMPNANYTCAGSASFRDAFTDANIGLLSLGRNSSSSLSTTACTVYTIYPNPITLTNFAVNTVVFNGS